MTVYDPSQPQSWDPNNPSNAQNVYANSQAGSGVAGGQGTTQSESMSNMTQGVGGYSGLTHWNWAEGDAFDDYNAPNLYNVINHGLNDLSNTAAPVTALTQLGAAQGAQNATLAPQAMLGGAQIAPQMMVNSAQLNNAGDAQLAGAQNKAINQLYATAQGQGPSVALEQARQVREQNLAQTMAALAGGGGALGRANAVNAGAAGNNQLTSAAALGHSTEAQKAQAAMGQALGGARGLSQAQSQAQAQLDQGALLANQGAFNQAGLSQASLNQQAALANQATGMQASTQNAQLLQQAALENANAANQFNLSQGNLDQSAQLADLQNQLQQNELNNQMFYGSLGAYQQLNQNDISNQMAYQELLAQQQNALGQIQAEVDVNASNNTMGMIGAGLGAAGALMLSDERGKKSVRKAGPELKNFLEAVGGWL